MINAGVFNKKISIISLNKVMDDDGFTTSEEVVILTAKASVKTTRGYTLITSNTDFEKAYTNFTIRYPNTEIKRDMFIKFNNKLYSIEYLNNIDEENKFLEIQAKVVVK